MTPVPVGMPKFATTARTALADPRLRRDLRNTAGARRERSAQAVAATPDWEELREAGRAIRDRTLLSLDTYLQELERAVTEAGGTVHWARNAARAGRVITGLIGRDAEVITSASPVTREIGLAGALATAGIKASETDLAELIEGFRASHPDAASIRELFQREIPAATAELAEDPAALAEVARTHLRDRFLSADVAVCGADFAIADTGTLVLVEGEGDGRMCLTLPRTLIVVAALDAVVPSWEDMEVFLQLLPRASSGDPMSPSVSTWTGLVPGDGPAEFHLVLVDNGRTTALADEVGRESLRCIRCTACSAVCPVYERTGAGPYGPVLPGPIGAVLTPQLRGVERAFEASLPYASTLCGACADVCPVKIDIPGLLVHLRGQVIESRRRRPVPTPEMMLMRTVAWTMGDRRRYETAMQRTTRGARLLARGGRIKRLPGLLGKWTEARDLPAPPRESFRAWWRKRDGRS